MGSRIECFWLEPTDQVRVSLRRYRGSAVESCPGPFGYHNASVDIGDEAKPLDPDGMLGRERVDIPHDDPRWPSACAGCGARFAESDVWQHQEERLFKGAPDGKLYGTRDMPAGSMYDADWWPVKGPDGIALAVILPPGGDAETWNPDTASKDGRPWTRTGTIPKVTCTPSILSPRYHGYLTDGWLVEC